MLEKAKLHFRQVVSGEGLQHLVVPEWGNATIYFKPMAALPIKIYSQLVTLAAQQTVEAFVDILILRGCGEQGPYSKRSIKPKCCVKFHRWWCVTSFGR